MKDDKNIATKKVINEKINPAKIAYEVEGKRRMAERKRKRNNEYRRLSARAEELNVPISAIKHNAPWECSSSPTGMKQICSYQGTCEYPCNGDC